MMDTNNKKPKKKVELKVKVNLWKVALIFFLILFFTPFFLAVLQTKIDSSRVELSQAIVDIKEGKVREVEVENERLTLTYKDGVEKTTTKEANLSFPELLDRSGVDPSTVNYKVSDQTLVRAVGEVVALLLPTIVVAALLFFIFRMQNKGAQDIFSFGRSRARLFAKGKQSITFSDVAGVDDAKKELEEVVDFLKNPAKYRRIGARTPKGVLLFGPSGVGKTLLARALAGEARVPFFSMAGSEFMEMLVGIGD